MPTILRVKGFRFWFYEADLIEPPHVHIGKAGNEAKFWLDPVSSANSRGFKDHELRDIERIIRHNQTYLLEMWQEEEKKHDSN